MDTIRTPLSPGGAKRRRSPTNEYGIPSAHHSQTSLPSFKQLEPYLRSQHMSSEPPSSYPYPGTSHYASHTGQQQQQESATSSQVLGAPQRDSGIYGAGDSEADEVDHHNPPKKKRRRQALSCTGDFFTLLFTCTLPLTVILSSLPPPKHTYLSYQFPSSYLSIPHWWLSTDEYPPLWWLISLGRLTFPQECKRRKIKCDRWADITMTAARITDADWQPPRFISHLTHNRSQPCTPCTRRGEEAGCQWHIVEPV